MIISVTIWVSSILFLTLLFSGKKREMKGKSCFLYIGSVRSDQKLTDLYESKRNWLKQVDWKYITYHLHAWAETLEKLGLKLAERMIYKITHMRDVATGKDLQKNKGHITQAFFTKFLK